MALIIKCLSCHRRLRDDAPCPGCGSTGRQVTVDYLPDGRHGRRVRKHLPAGIALEDAQALDELIRKASRERGKPVVVNTGATAAELFPDYLSWYEMHRAPTTYKDVDQVYENHLQEAFGSLPIRSISPSHVELYQRTRRATGVKNRTINKELDYFSGFLRWCRRERKMDNEKLVIDKLPYSRPLPIVLSPGEALAIIRAAEPIYRAFFLCLYGMGLRFSEARNLKWDDVDFQNQSVRVIQKGGTYKLLPMTDMVRKAIKAVGKAKAGEYVFMSRRIEGPIRDIRKAIERAKKKAGITKKVTPHIFRHSVATHFLSQDVNLRTIQKYLGHAQSTTTEFYTHVALDHLRTAADGLFKRAVSDKSLKRLKVSAGSKGK